MENTSLCQQITDMLATKKEMAGVGGWNTGPRHDAEGQFRWMRPLTHEGHVTPLRLVVDSFPRNDELKFTILLTFNITITRIEYYEFASHLNKPPTPKGVPEGLIFGPHIHSWNDNSHLCSDRFGPPKILEFARHLPTQVRGFENTFRWFCGEMNIECNHEVPDLPPRDLLV